MSNMHRRFWIVKSKYVGRKSFTYTYVVLGLKHRCTRQEYWRTSGISTQIIAPWETRVQFGMTLRACSYWQKLSRLARKLFDKFTSEISPCYENNMKSYIAFIWDEKFSRVPRSRLLTGEMSVTGIMFSPLNTTFPLSGITICRVSNFSIQLMFNATSQPETFPGKWDNISPYEQNKSIWLVEKFSR
jgi:hypothetical protein